MTTLSPPSRAIRADSQSTIPSWSQRQRAPVATASLACSAHSSGRRNTSTMSNVPVAATASDSVGKAGTPATSDTFGLTGTQSNPTASMCRNTSYEARQADRMRR